MIFGTHILYVSRCVDGDTKPRHRRLFIFLLSFDKNEANLCAHTPHHSTPQSSLPQSVAHFGTYYATCTHRRLTGFCTKSGNTILHQKLLYMLSLELLAQYTQTQGKKRRGERKKRICIICAYISYFVVFVIIASLSRANLKIHFRCYKTRENIIHHRGMHSTHINRDDEDGKRGKSAGKCMRNDLSRLVNEFFSLSFDSFHITLAPLIHSLDTCNQMYIYVEYVCAE